MSQFIDPASAIGKAPEPEAHFTVVVVGAGPAGLSAALTAARSGLQTLLVDENPIDPGLMALDVPLHFGQRAAIGANTGGAIEQLLESNPGLAEAFEAGIDVQLGVSAWAVYLNGETVHSLEKPLIGLADRSRSWLVSFDRLVVAAGARDLGMSFPGWEKPGVMGAQAAERLIKGYNAFNGRRLLILGMGALGRRTAELARAAGLEVAGILDVDETPALLAQAESIGVPLFPRHAIVRATGAAEVDGAVIVELAADGSPLPQTTRNVACDTIVLAIGSVPNIELVASAGAGTRFDPLLGGYVPMLGDGGLTSLAPIFAAGDCAGTYEGKLLDEAIAAAEGAAAAVAVARSQGLAAEAAPSSIDRSPPVVDQFAVLQRWIEVHGRLGSNDTIVCQCEEVTRAEILGVRPPRYLGWNSEGIDRRDIATLAADGPVNQDQIKRLTRAGMGPCQGRRCREQVQVLIASATGVSPGEVPLASYRPPVRPLSLDVFAATEESDEMRETWVAWFNIASQWTPHWLQAETPADGPARKIVSGK